jgi:hypothetical protein
MLLCLYRFVVIHGFVRIRLQSGSLSLSLFTYLLIDFDNAGGWSVGSLVIRLNLNQARRLALYRYIGYSRMVLMILLCILLLLHPMYFCCTRQIQ